MIQFCLQRIWPFGRFMAILIAIPLSQVRDKLVQFIGVFDAWYSTRQKRKLTAAVFYSSVVLLILLSLTFGKI